MTARFSKTALLRVFLMLLGWTLSVHAARKGGVFTKTRAKSAVIPTPVMGSFDMHDGLQEYVTGCLNRVTYMQDDFADPKYGATRRAAVAGSVSTSLMRLDGGGGVIKTYYGGDLIHQQGNRVYNASVRDIANATCVLEYLKSIYQATPWSYVSSPGSDAINVFISNTGLAPNPPDLYDPIVSGADYPGMGGIGEVQLALDVVENMDYALLVHEMCHVFTGGYIAAFKGSYRTISEGVCEFYTHWFMPKNVVFNDNFRRYLEVRWRNPLNKNVVTSYDESYWMPTHVWAFVTREWGETAMAGFITRGGLLNDTISPWSALAMEFVGGDTQVLAGAYLRSVINGVLVGPYVTGKLNAFYKLDQSQASWILKPAAPFKALEAYGFEIVSVGDICPVTGQKCVVKVVSAPEERPYDVKKWVCLMMNDIVSSKSLKEYTHTNTCIGVDKTSWVAIMHTYDDWGAGGVTAYSLQRIDSA